MNAAPGSSISRIDQIAELLAQRPPRYVSPELKRAAMKGAAPLVLALVGGFFLVLGSVLFGVFAPWGLTRDWRLQRLDRAVVTEGRILTVEETSMEINEAMVLRSTFDFRSSDGRWHEGVCYTSGSEWNAGQLVPVRYDPADPTLALPVGGRFSPADATTLVMMIFPLAGAGMLAGAVISRRRRLRLLTHGLVAEARVVDIQKTNTSINDHPVFKIVLDRLDQPPDRPTIIRRWRPDIVRFAVERLETKQPVFVLYDPAKPRRAMLPEAL